MKFSGDNHGPDCGRKETLKNDSNSSNAANHDATRSRTRLVLLDDYHDVAMSLVDWSPLQERCEISVLQRHLADLEEAAQVLAPYEVICTLRERMEIPRGLIANLPNLRHLVVTGKRYARIDVAGAAEHGVAVSICPPAASPGVGGVVELAWALILAASRNLPLEDRMMRQGVWQTGIGSSVGGKVLGIIGLGSLGSRVAQIGRAFGMEVLAWSRNLTDEAAKAVGARRVDKDTLLQEADYVTLHVVLGPASRGLIGSRELALMKSEACLINTSRGPLVDESALIEALKTGIIAKAALDVYDEEPLPENHPLRSLDNVILSPHMGYYTRQTVASYYRGAIENILAYLEGNPIRLVTQVES